MLWTTQFSIVRSIHPMYANFASATLVVLGAVIAVLGFILAGELAMVIVGLASIFAGGLLDVAARRRAD